MADLKCPKCKTPIIETHVLYRFFDSAGNLLYVGVTNDPPGRFKAHSQNKDWWVQVANITIQHCETRDELLAKEKAAIQDEQPTYNVIYQLRAVL